MMTFIDNVEGLNPARMRLSPNQPPLTPELLARVGKGDAQAFAQKRGSPMAWLVTLTRSRAIDRLRASASRARNLTDSIEETSDDLRSALPDPFDTHALEELRMLVMEAFKDLPAPQQEAIELAFYGGLTHAEIAAKLDKPIGTVKTRIKLGMNKLRYALRPCWEAK